MRNFFSSPNFFLPIAWRIDGKEYRSHFGSRYHIWSMRLAGLFVSNLLKSFRDSVRHVTKYRLRPYHDEYTGSLPNSEVNRHRARSVLGWGTAWEDPWVLQAFCFALLNPNTNPNTKSNRNTKTQIQIQTQT